MADGGTAESAKKTRAPITGRPGGQRMAMQRSRAMRAMLTRLPWLPPSTTNAVGVSPTYRPTWPPPLRSNTSSAPGTSSVAYRPRPQLAQAFARLGAQVTQVEMAPRLLAREDEDVSAFVRARLEGAGASIVMPLVGRYATSMEMAGVSFTLCKLDAELEGFLKAPCDCAFWSVA